MVKIAFLYAKRKESQAIYDHIESFKKYSQNTIFYFDVFTTVLTYDLLNSFNVVVIHYSVTLFDHDRMSPALLILLRNFGGKKIVFLQDEYRCVDAVKERLVYLRTDILFTVISRGSEIKKVYSDPSFSHIKKISILTGYVDDYLLYHNRPHYKDRLLDVVYRVKNAPVWLGEFSQKKVILGKKFSQNALAYNLKIDISSNLKDRLYGEDWINFLKSSKAALGCESGASVFDFTGEIEAKTEKYLQDFPHASFKEVQKKFFQESENKIVYKEISPRCFEYAAVGTLMILYEGAYNNILQPWIHYVPLKDDHSNMDEVIRIIKNPVEWKRITDNAYRDLIASKKYSYKKFIELFDLEVQQLFVNNKKFISSVGKTKKINVKKVKNVSQSNISFSFIKIGRFLINGIKYCCGFFPKKTRLSLEKKLIKMESIGFVYLKTIYRIVLSRDWKYLIYLLDSDFHQEYQFITDVSNYCVYIKLATGNTPILVSNNCILIDPDTIKNKISVDSLAQEIRVVSAIDSCSLPKNIRGKKMSCKYDLGYKIIEGMQ